MDELGSSIRHSNTHVNVCCTSFFFAPSATMFTIFYPIVRIDQPYSEIFRNFVYDNKDTLEREIRLLPWQYLNDRKTFLRNLMIEHKPELFNKQLHDNLEIYKKCHKNDLYDQNLVKTKSSNIDSDGIWKVYTDHDLVKQYLTDQHYQLIDDPNQADILFIMKQLEDFREESLEGKLINQFPLENIVTNKELLALVARRWKSLYGLVSFTTNKIKSYCFSSSSSSDNDPYVDSQGNPPWLAITFNLTYELTQFAAYFQVFFVSYSSFWFVNSFCFSTVKINILIIHGLSNQSI